MIQLNSKTLSARRARLMKKETYGGITEENLDTGLETTKDIEFLMDFENDAVELHLNNLINTYGVGKVKKILNELTKLKKVG